MASCGAPSHPGRPVRVEYELTEMGRALAPAVRELERWAQRWLRTERAYTRTATKPLRSATL